MTSAETIDIFSKYVIANYKRFPVCLVRGEGSYVWDAEGKRYLDFFPGWGCNLIGRGVIDAGMIPKVEACLDSLRAGVKKTHMIDGRLRHSLLLEIYTDRGVGTEITLGQQ